MPPNNGPIKEMKLIERVGGENEESKGEEGKMSKSYAKKLAKKQAAIDAKKAGGSKPAAGDPRGKKPAGDAASAASTQASGTAVAAEEEKKGDDYASIETRLAENQWLGGAKPSKEDAEKFTALTETPSSSDYPRTFAWYSLTSRFPAEIREAWTAATGGEAEASGEMIPLEDRKVDYR